MATAVLQTELVSDKRFPTDFDSLTLRAESSDRFPPQHNGAGLLHAATPTEFADTQLDLTGSGLSDPDFRGLVADFKTGGIQITPETLVVADSLKFAAELLAERLVGLRVFRRAFVATAWQEVLKCVSDRQSSMIVTEARLTDGGVLRLAEELDRTRHPARLVVLTQHLPDFITERLREMGVAAIIDKSLSLAAILQQLLVVAGGGRIQVPEVEVPQDDAILPVGTPGAGLSFIRQLSTRQYEVLVLLAEGLSVKDVAAQMGLSSKTIDSLKYRLMKMLNFNDRVQLTRFAIREGLIDP